MGPRGASQAVELQRNLSEIFNGEDSEEDSDYGGGGKSQFARDAEIVGPILLGGLIVFAALIFLCTCSSNRGGGGRGDNGKENVLPHMSCTYHLSVGYSDRS